MAGTDSAAQQTKAIDKGDYYEITGSKIFITNAEEADVYVIFAMTDPELELVVFQYSLWKRNGRIYFRSSWKRKWVLEVLQLKELVFDRLKYLKKIC